MPRVSHQFAVELIADEEMPNTAEVAKLLEDAMASVLRRFKHLTPGIGGQDVDVDVSFETSFPIPS